MSSTAIATIEIYENTSGGMFYLYNGIPYDMNVPPSLPANAKEGTGPRTCSICRAGCVRGVYVAHCKSCDPTSVVKAYDYMKYAEWDKVGRIFEQFQEEDEDEEEEEQEEEEDEEEEEEDEEEEDEEADMDIDLSLDHIDVNFQNTDIEIIIVEQEQEDDDQEQEDDEEQEQEDDEEIDSICSDNDSRTDFSRELQLMEQISRPSVVPWRKSNV